MSDHEHSHNRAIDRWIKWVALIGPLVTYLLGVPTGYLLAKQQIEALSGRTSLLEGWKTRQEDFNLNTVKAITRIKALIKDTEP